MAERRMFAKTIIDSDDFIDMPISARLLYYDLAMRADDDGFVNAPKKIMRFVGASMDDMNVLIARQFLIPFESGVVVVRHWLIHNYIRKDTYKETTYQEEKARLRTDKNKSYILKNDTSSTNCQRTVNELSTQDNKNILYKGNKVIDKECIECSAPQNTKPTRHKYGEYKNVLLSDEEFEKLKEEFPDDWESRIERLSEYIASSGKSYKNHLATIRKWSKADAEKKAAEQKKAETISTKSSKSKFNNYTDTNKPDYSSFSEQIISDMLTEQARKETNNESKQDNF